MLLGIGDAKVRKLIGSRIDGLKDIPEQQGKPLWDKLKGCRSLRASRYRVVYRVSRSNPPPGCIGSVTVVGIGIRREGSKSDIYAVLTKMAKDGEL